MNLFKWFKRNKNEDNDSNSKSYLFQEEPDIPDPDHITLQEALDLYKPDFYSELKVMDGERLRRHILYSVVLGDVSGSMYEGVQYPKDFTHETIELFSPHNHITDDTVMTVAVYKATQKIKSESIEDENEIVDVYTEHLKHYVDLYPNLGYGGGFLNWALSDSTERGMSYGNGSCMRVGGIAVLFDDVDDVIKYAYYSALPSHSHREGVKGAVCTAVIYWMLIFGAQKDDVYKYLNKHYPANNGRLINGSTTIDDLVEMNKVNPWSTLTVTCQTSLVEAAINFLESDSFENCLRNSYRYLCDRDTLSAIAAPMAAIFYQDMTVGGECGEEIVKRYLDEKLLNDIEN